MTEGKQYQQLQPVPVYSQPAWPVCRLDSERHSGSYWRVNSATGRDPYRVSPSFQKGESK